MFKCVLHLKSLHVCYFLLLCIYNIMYLWNKRYTKVYNNTNNNNNNNNNNYSYNNKQIVSVCEVFIKSSVPV